MSRGTRLSADLAIMTVHINVKVGLNRENSEKIHENLRYEKYIYIFKMSTERKIDNTKALLIYVGSNKIEFPLSEYLLD